MNRRNVFHAAILILLLTATTVGGQDYSPVYKKGTIRSSDKHLEDFSSIQGNADKHHTKIYQLEGPDGLYEIDYCGAFQRGKFTPGQTVDYRVEGKRLYIRRDGGKEYKCKIESKKP